MDEVARVGTIARILWIITGVVGPLACVTVELKSGMCREAIFDPIPTFWHVLLILTVPAATLFGLRSLDRPKRRSRALGFLLGCAASVSVLYSLPFVFYIPFSIVLIPAGIGLLGLAPIAAPFAALSIAILVSIRDRGPGDWMLRWTVAGFLSGGSALFVLWASRSLGGH